MRLRGNDAGCERAGWSRSKTGNDALLAYMRKDGTGQVSRRRQSRNDPRDARVCRGDSRIQPAHARQNPSSATDASARTAYIYEMTQVHERTVAVGVPMRHIGVNKGGPMNWNQHAFCRLALVLGTVLTCASQAQPRLLPQNQPAARRVDARYRVRREHATTLAQLLQAAFGWDGVPAPDGGIVVRMEAPNSFYGNQSPLFVVDGISIDAGNTLSWLDPHDVETVQALKDPSQTAIYGLRGANG